MRSALLPRRLCPDHGQLGSNAKSAAGRMPKATRSDRTCLIARDGHSLHFGLSAPPTASQASEGRTARRTDQPVRRVQSSSHWKIADSGTRGTFSGEHFRIAHNSAKIDLSRRELSRRRPLFPWSPAAPDVRVKGPGFRPIAANLHAAPAA